MPGVTRNPLGRVAAQAKREARAEATTAEDVGQGTADARGQRLAGQDDGSGTWLPYGLLDITPLSEFRLS